MLKRNFMELLEVATLNKCCLAYVENKLEEKGILLHEMRPKCLPHLEMVGKDFIALSPHDFMGGIEIGQEKCVAKITKEELFDNGNFIYIFDKHLKGELDDLVSRFHSILEPYKYIDIIFPRLPDSPPYPTSTICDPETGFCTRSLLGMLDFSQNIYEFVFDFDFLIVDRYREMGIDEATGLQQIKPVKLMTDEERKLYNVQPKKKGEDNE